MKPQFWLTACCGLLLVLGCCMAFAADAGDKATPQTRVNAIDGAEMVWVPEGVFTMGVDAAPPDAEGRPQVNAPKHQVTLDGYWIYKFPVTVKQYRAYCTATGAKMPHAPLWGWKDDHPIVNVTWDDGINYGKWGGATLPTVAQWEKAARGTDERLYPWGNTWDEKKCTHSDKVWGDHNSTSPVGSNKYDVTPYGAMDMAGNVREWCNDWFGEDYYKTSPALNPPGPPWEVIPHKLWSTFKVARGGAWCLCDAKDFQTVNRDWCMGGNMWEMDTGFRCVIAGK